MNKDSFEIKIGEQLREARMQVPDGAWEAIKAQIKPRPTGVSNTSFLTGLGSGVVLLASLATYSYFKEIDQDRIAQTPVIQSVKNIELENAQNESAENSTELKVGPNLDGENVRPKLTVAVTEIVETFEKELAKVDGSENATQEIDLANIPSKSPVALDVEPLQKQTMISPAKTAAPDQAISEENSKSAEALVEDVVAKIEASKLKGYAPLNVSFKNSGKGDRAYWDFGVLGDSQKKSTDVTFTEPGLYTVYLEVSNSKGDLSTDFVTVEVMPASVINLPNSITPNGDGVNDVFAVGRAIGIQEFLLIITNETGDVVFQTRSLEEPWEFDRSMHSQENSRYFYTYRALGVDGKTHSADLQPLTVILN